MYTNRAALARTEARRPILGGFWCHLGRALRLRLAVHAIGRSVKLRPRHRLRRPRTTRLTRDRGQVVVRPIDPLTIVDWIGPWIDGERSTGWDDRINVAI